MVVIADASEQEGHWFAPKQMASLCGVFTFSPLVCVGV